MSKIILDLARALYKLLEDYAHPSQMASESGRELRVALTRFLYQHDNK